jgi:hypothetical protein
VKSPPEDPKPGTPPLSAPLPKPKIKWGNPSPLLALQLSNQFAAEWLRLLNHVLRLFFGAFMDLPTQSHQRVRQ